jgi:hypothetical protein
MRLVLIHLGSAPAEYMWANVEHLLALNSRIEIDVITSPGASIPTPTKNKVNLFEYSANEKIEKLLISLELDGAYRQGFWRYSLERLFALAAHHKRFQIESLLHIESDVLLLETFPFKSFEQISKLAWSKLDDKRDVASLLYSPNQDASDWLQNKIMDVLLKESNLNDMQILSFISNNFPANITILPTLPKDNKEIISNKCNISIINKSRTSENTELFAGIFDAAPIGIWLTGSHGVNSFGISRRYDNNLVFKSNSILIPSKMELKYVSGSGLFFTSGEIQIPIHTLHIHSKDIRFFSSLGQKLIAKYVSESKKNRLVRSFSIRVLLDLVKDNYKKRTLIRFLSWLPPFNKYRIFRDFLRK